MRNLAVRLTVEQASLAFIATCIAMILLLHLGELRLGAMLHVAEATYQQSPLPRTCKSDSLAPLSGDLRSFDPRWQGYSYAEAKALLCAMHANDKLAATQYLGNRFYWDMVFPITYGPCLAIVLLFLVGRAQLSSWWAFGAFALPLSGAAFDVAENFMVRGLIETGPTATMADVELASYLTVIKYALVFPAFVFGVLGMVILLARRSFRHRQDDTPV